MTIETDQSGLSHSQLLAHSTFHWLESLKTVNINPKEIEAVLKNTLDVYFVYQGTRDDLDQFFPHPYKGGWILAFLDIMEARDPSLRSHYVEFCKDWLIEFSVNTGLDDTSWEPTLRHLIAHGLDLHRPVTSKYATSDKQFQNMLHEQLFLDVLNQRAKNGQGPGTLSQFMIDAGVDLDPAWNDPDHSAAIRSLLPEEKQRRLLELATPKPPCSGRTQKM